MVHRPAGMICFLLHHGVGDDQVLVQGRDPEIEFLICDDQGRGDDEVRPP
jgi:hypothetical protein